MNRVLPAIALLTTLLLRADALGQTLEEVLKSENAATLAAAARQQGDARRGAIAFHQLHIGCIKCHSVDGSENSLGPDLTKPANPEDSSDQHIIQSILQPSAKIRRGYEPITVVDVSGRSITGLLLSRTDEAITIRDPANDGERRVIPAADIEESVNGRVSIMPAGVVNQLAGRQQFLDLARYVLEIRSGGLEVARKLQPPPGLVTFRLPDYEAKIDHVALIRNLDNDAFQRGEKIYNRLCINCHGDLEKPGSLPTALRFAEGKFRSGGDPYTMYRTLTHGFGLMVPQTWMVPKQKYDVVHYIREHYVRERNSAQFKDVTDEYLATLPSGDTLGPEPVEYAPWSDMNYGPSMINTFEVGSDGSNFAYKGIAVRLDPGPGGVSRGNKWAVFDHDTMRMAAAWSRPVGSRDKGFINWEGIHFDGRHARHPRVAGDLHLQNPTGPGWAKPNTTSFEDNERVLGRDNRRYGPLPRNWAKYHGLHTVGDMSVVEYSVGDRRMLECLGHLDYAGEDTGVIDVFTRTLNVAGGQDASAMLLATLPEGSQLRQITPSAVLSGQLDSVAAVKPDTGSFDGDSWMLVPEGSKLDMTNHDFSITARIRTKQDGTIFSRTAEDGPWVHDAKALFIRGGYLTYDIGWVGAVRGNRRVNDGKWHDVAVTWNHETAVVRLFVDGKVTGVGELRPEEAAPNHVAKIGFASQNFPGSKPFQGEIDSLSFWNSELSQRDIQDGDTSPDDALASWDFHEGLRAKTVSTRRLKLAAELVAGGQAQKPGLQVIAGVIDGDTMSQFSLLGKRLCLDMPAAANAESIVVWTASLRDPLPPQKLENLVASIEDRLKTQNLRQKIDQGGPPRWPEIIPTQPIVGPANGPFAIDVLSTPAANPWFCRIRLTGHDFFSDQDRVAVCSWDGDVWVVSGLRSLAASDTPQLKWRRIASGLFQPLGLKIVAGDIYLTCRDQLVILRDNNRDGETDFYECFNNDHQVTEHFHEFAMGLQRDEIGNFYYAKSARHALKAVVPHHGTLLMIPSDGSRTEILANGFRAANGVCLNPDGSFIVTDQEGHWNPKNRINWVRKGGFYGNMFGYHDVTDSSDDAMEQPLCWITNAFDRSPAELMWVNNDAWGPLNGTLLNLSYGYGKVFVVPHENVDGQMQGGMCQLPIPQFPTGIVRGRISPHDNGLYLTGMFAWASSQQAQEGGFYRLRYTGQPSYMPVGLRTSEKQITIDLTEAVDEDFAAQPENYSVRVWSLKRTASYGSKHYDERKIAVAAATTSNEGRSVTLTIPDLSPTWCMEIRCRLRGINGQTIERVIHNTIHRVPK